MTIWIRGQIEYSYETGEGLAGVVRHVLVHETSHHFGLFDRDMECIEVEL